MASLVDASVKILHSGMVGAPSLSGATTGSRIAFLKTLFVDGWGSQNATSVTVENGICTLNFATAPAVQPGFVANVVGCTDPLLNGDQRILTQTPTTLSFRTAAANSTQTTGASAKFAPLGWLQPFTASSSQIAFKMPSAVGSQNFIMFTDNATNHIRAQGYEAMTSLGVGTQAFPTDAQVAATGVYWHMQYNASGTAVPWVLIGDERGFYFLVQTYFQTGATYANYTAYVFTDVNSLRTNDPKACYITGHNTTTYSAAGINCGLMTRQQGYAWLARPNTGIGGPVPAMSISSTNNIAIAAQWSGGTNSGFGNYPNLTDNSLQLGDFLVVENPAVAASQTIRGLLPGVAFASQPLANAFNSFDVVPAATTGPYKDRTIMGFKVEQPQYQSSTANSPGCTFFDTTGPWR